MKKFLMLALVVGSFSLAGSDMATAAPSGAYTKPATQAAANAEGRRSVRYYSYSPAAVPAVANDGGRRSVRSYSYTPGAASVMRRTSPARVPSYLLPKTDPRKYNGF